MTGLNTFWPEAFTLIMMRQTKDARKFSQNISILLRLLMYKKED